MAFFTLLAGLTWSGSILPAILLFYLLLSGITFTLYGLDKSAARHDRWRTPEARLHLFGIAGGWPGALLAQQLFRHKTRKQPFQFIFWCAVMLNCAGLAWLVTTNTTLTGLL